MTKEGHIRRLLRSVPSSASGIPSYLLAHFAKSQLWHASTLLFGFFLTEISRVAPDAMGWILTASLLLNGLVDLALGKWWGQRVDSLGAAYRMQARAAPLICACFLLFCLTPLVWEAARPLWALGTLLGFRASYPLLDVAQNAAPSLLPITARERRGLIAHRNIASGIAGILVCAVAAPLLIQYRDPWGYLLWAAAVASLACASAWRLPRAGGRVAPLRPVLYHATPASVPFSTVLAALAGVTFAGTVFRATEPYYAAFVGHNAALLLWTAIGATVSQPLWLWCRNRWSIEAMLAAAAALSLLSAAVLLGTQRASTASAIAVGLGFGAGSGGLWLMLWSAMADRAAQGNATRHVGAFTCVSKLAQSAAMLLTGQVLALSSYRTALRDPFSLPSLLMVGMLLAIAGICIALALDVAFRRTRSDGRSAPRRPADPRVRVRGRLPG
nr:MFS transporter [Sphingomonas sp. TDK1]